MKFAHNLTSDHLFLDECISSNFEIRHVASHLEALNLSLSMIVLNSRDR